MVYMNTVICTPVRGMKRTHRVIKTTVELPVALWQAIKRQAIEEQSDLRGIIEKAVEQYLNKRASGRREASRHAR
jgi:hypothetical protein